MWRPKKGQQWRWKEWVIITQRKRHYGWRISKLPTTHECLCCKRVEKVNCKLENLQLSMKDQVSISRLRSGHHPDLKYWLHMIGKSLDTVCRKYGAVEETVERSMGECPRIHHPTSQLPKPYLIATNPSKPWRCGSCGKQNLIFQGFHNRGNSPNPSAQLLAQQQQKQQLQRDFEYITCKGCRARYQDIEQSSTTNNPTVGLSSDPPPCSPANRTIHDCDQSLEVVGSVKGKTILSRDFTYGATHLSRLCYCLLDNYKSSSSTREE